MVSEPPEKDSLEGEISGRPPAARKCTSRGTVCCQILEAHLVCLMFRSIDESYNSLASSSPQYLALLWRAMRDPSITRILETLACNGIGVVFATDTASIGALAPEDLVKRSLDEEGIVGNEAVKELRKQKQSYCYGAGSPKRPYHVLQ